MSLEQTSFVPGTNPGFLLILHHGNPVCPRDKPVWFVPGTIPETKGGRKVYVLKVYVPFSLAKLPDFIPHFPESQELLPMPFVGISDTISFKNCGPFQLQQRKINLNIKFVWAGYPADVRADIWADVPAQKLSPHRSERRKIELLRGCP